MSIACRLSATTPLPGQGLMYGSSDAFANERLQAGDLGTENQHAATSSATGD